MRRTRLKSITLIFEKKFIMAIRFQQIEGVTSKMILLYVGLIYGSQHSLEESQLSQQEIKATCQLARVRIHVEWIIGQLRKQDIIIKEKVLCDVQHSVIMADFIMPETQQSIKVIIYSQSCRAKFSESQRN